MKKVLYYLGIIFLLAVFFFGSAWAVDLYIKNCPTSISLDKKSDIKPQDPVVLRFSKQVLFAQRVRDISVSPKKDFKISWEENNTKLVLTPESFWDPGTNYSVVFPGGRNTMLAKIKKTELFFSTVAYPEVIGVYPHDGQKDVLVDIEDPIVVDFDKSTKGFFINFVLEPDPEVTYLNNSEKTQFKILPNGKLEEGRTYNLKIYAKYEKDTDAGYKQIYASSFQTLPPPPANWDKDFTIRLEQARKYTRPLIISGKYIDINLSQQILSTFENGKLLDAYLISSGKPGMNTPKGNFKIENKAARPWSKAYSLYMPYWNAIVPDGKFGIHELPEWPGGYKEGANHLGTPVSHGCVRLGVGPAKIFYEWADLGTPIVIH